MKRLVQILFSVLLLCSFSTVAVAQSRPEYKDTNNIGLDFYINSKGIATVLCSVSVKPDVSSPVNVEIVIEKHIFGPFWQQVSETYTETFSEKYHVSKITCRIDEDGRYRVVINAVIGVDKVRLNAECEYKSGYILGDVNDDTRVNAADARLILRYSAQLEKSEMIKNRGDINGDGKITAIDARLLLRLSVALRQEDLL